MSITASGLISQIDYKSIIEQLVELKRQPIYQLEAEKDALETTRSAYSVLESRLNDLKSAADDLRQSSDFNVFTTSVTDETILTATAGSSASPGSYEITVSAIAKSHKLIANGVSSETTVISSTTGYFKFTVGSGSEQTVNVDTSTTLEDLRDSINNLNAGVTATIVNDGTSYRLILTSDNTGTSNQISITQNDTDLTFSTLQSAQDASITVDGLTITRSSNTISDVITGVTLSLKSSDSSKTVTLTVSRDTEEIEKKVVAFLDKYNAVVNYIRSNNRYDTDTNTAEPFFSDPIARSVWEDLRRIMTSEISGLPSTMNRLIHIGAQIDTEGTFSLDSSKLSSALSSNFDDVVNLFIDGTSTDGFAALVYDLTDDMTDFVDGRVTERQEGITDSIDRLEREIEKKEAELAAYEEQLRIQFAALEALLAGLKSQSDYLTSL